MNPNHIFLTEGEQACNSVEFSLWNITTELSNMINSLDHVEWVDRRTKRTVGTLKYRIHSMQLEAAGLQSKIDELRHNQEGRK